MQTFLCACITVAIMRDQRQLPTKGEKNLFQPGKKKENQIKQTLLSVKISNVDLKLSVLNPSGLFSVFVSHDAPPQPCNAATATAAAAAAAAREKRARRARRPATSSRSRH